MDIRKRNYANFFVLATFIFFKVLFPVFLEISNENYEISRIGPLR